MRRGEGWDVVRGVRVVLREESMGKVVGIGLRHERPVRCVDVRSRVLRWGKTIGGRVVRVVRGFERRIRVERAGRCVREERGWRVQKSQEVRSRVVRVGKSRLKRGFGGL